MVVDDSERYFGPGAACGKIFIGALFYMINRPYLLKQTFQIDWERRKVHDQGEDCLISVDCTDVPIQEPSPFSKRWYSHKLNKAGLRYEVGVSLKGGDVVWIHGPFPCGEWPDISIFRSCLKLHLDKGERVEADNGYSGEEPLSCKTPGGFYSRSENMDADRARLRSRHETVNMRLKVFNILNNKYRHGRQDHAFVFRAVAVLVQLAIESGEPLFKL
jgi:hypothetical protein